MLRSLSVNTESAALASWAFEPLPAFGLLLTALIYFLGWRKLHRQVPARYPVWRLACFLGGLTTLYVSFASPLDAFASFLLISHMVQHLLLNDLGLATSLHLCVACRYFPLNGTQPK